MKPQMRIAHITTQIFDIRRSYVELSGGLTPLFPEEMLHGVIIVGAMCILIGSFFTIITKELEI